MSPLGRSGSRQSNVMESIVSSPAVKPNGGPGTENQKGFNFYLVHLLKEIRRSNILYLHSL